MRYTKQRAAILRVLNDTDEHPTADWIFREVRKEVPHISLGTVYRLLNTLSEEGAINVLSPESGANRYDGSPGLHHHVVCTGCGRITDAPVLIAPTAPRDIERVTGYVVSHLRLDWYGVCPACHGADEGRGVSAPARGGEEL